jgi:hypothetical protein
MPEGYVLDKPFSLSCPECGGVLREEHRAIRQFRCHIGHVLTAETVLVAQFAEWEKKLAGAMALLNERAELCQQMAEDARNRERRRERVRGGRARGVGARRDHKEAARG